VRSKVSANGRSQLMVWLALASITPIALADTVFRTTGAYGEVSFSDVELPGATPIELPTTVIDPARIVEQQAIIEQQLRVAQALQDSRLARQAAATERALAFAASRPQVVTVEAQVERYTNGYYFPSRLPGHGKHRQRGFVPVAATHHRARHVFRPVYPGIARLSRGHSGSVAHPSRARRSAGARLPVRSEPRQ